MDYKKLLSMYKSGDPEKTQGTVQNILSPGPLDDPDQLAMLIPSRFKYIGPGRWTKIVRDFQIQQNMTEE